MWGRKLGQTVMFHTVLDDLNEDPPFSPAFGTTVAIPPGYRCRVPRTTMRKGVGAVPHRGMDRGVARLLVLMAADEVDIEEGPLCSTPCEAYPETLSMR